LIALPEKLRKTLERIVRELRAREDVYGIGLFGSWSRGDAAASSDVDLFILDKANFSYEYVDRLQVGGFLIDLDHVPKQWIHSAVPPEIDQKLHEMQILYDRDWSLTNTKLLMAKSYSSSERVDIRTEAHVVESDIYLSRATSAFSRQDFGSSCLFATVALENILRVLIEIALQPFSNSRFIEILENSAKRLGMHSLFTEYLKIAGLNRPENAVVKDKLELFKTIWNETNAIAKQNLSMLESSHFKVRAKLNYYLNPAFLQGAVTRATSLIDSEKIAEASHYLKNILLDIVENYVWLKSSIDNIKIDYTTLIRSLESLEEKNPKNYENIIRFLGLGNVEKTVASHGVGKAREMILKIRKDRKTLIKNHVPASR